jgi:hypothetical protein
MLLCENIGCSPNLEMDFYLSDAVDTATAVLAMMCTIPIPSEIKDILDIRNSAS